MQAKFAVLSGLWEHGKTDMLSQLYRTKKGVCRRKHGGEEVEDRRFANVSDGSNVWTYPSRHGKAIYYSTTGGLPASYRSAQASIDPSRF